jgi:hypothetical protein
MEKRETRNQKRETRNQKRETGDKTNLLNILPPHHLHGCLLQLQTGHPVIL